VSFWKKKRPTEKVEDPVDSDFEVKEDAPVESKLPPPREMICELESPEGNRYRVYIQEGQAPTVWQPDNSMHEPIWLEIPRRIMDRERTRYTFSMEAAMIPNPEWCAAINEALRRD
jgi:hypothetical protein